MKLDVGQRFVFVFAVGNTCKSTGSVNIPVALRVVTLNVLVVTALSHVLILGVDFWKCVGIIPDLLYGSWKFCGGGLFACADSAGVG